MPVTQLYNTSSSDEQLMISLCGGIDTIPELTRRYDPLLNAFISKRIFDRSQIDDARQDIWFQVHKSKTNYNPALPFRNWLLGGIAPRVVAGFYNKQRRLHAMEINESRLHKTPNDNGRENHFDPPSQDQSPTHRALEKELNHRIRENLPRIPRIARKTVELIALNGLSCADAARQLNVTQKTVRNRYHSAVITLREFGIELPPLPPKIISTTKKKTSLEKNVSEPIPPLAQKKIEPATQGILNKIGDLLPQLQSLGDYIGRLDMLLSGMPATPSILPSPKISAPLPRNPISQKH